MGGTLLQRLVTLGFSEYEAKAYLALLKDSPASGYRLAKLSGVPRSMIYEVMAKLIDRGAAMTMRSRESTKYAPLPADEFLNQLLEEHQELIRSIQRDIAGLFAAPNLEYVWNIEGHDSIMAKATEMIGQAESRAYLALLPVTFDALRTPLHQAIERGVQVVLYTTSSLDLPGGRVVVVATPEQALGDTGGLGVILVVDGREVLIAEWMADHKARASWTSSPLLVFLTEHHLRTDLYLPRVLALLGERALDVIQEDDRELFARALESHIGVHSGQGN